MASSSSSSTAQHSWPLQAGSSLLDTLFGDHGTAHNPSPDDGLVITDGASSAPHLLVSSDDPSASASSPSSATAIGGYIAVLTAGLFFGSNFVPARKYPTGNGVFFQWTMCSGIFLTGLVLQGLLGFPTVPKPHFAMLGGMSWCMGNLMAVPIIQRIGMALGLCVWNVCNMLVGWTSGFLGILGASKADVAVPWLNCTGAFLACCACACYMNIKPTMSKKEAERQLSFIEKRASHVDTLMGSAGGNNREVPRILITTPGGPGSPAINGGKMAASGARQSALASPLMSGTGHKKRDAAADEDFSATTLAELRDSSKSASSADLQVFRKSYKGPRDSRQKEDTSVFQSVELSGQAALHVIQHPNSSIASGISRTEDQAQEAEATSHAILNPAHTTTTTSADHSPEKHQSNFNFAKKGNSTRPSPVLAPPGSGPGGAGGGSGGHRSKAMSRIGRISSGGTTTTLHPPGHRSSPGGGEQQRGITISSNGAAFGPGYGGFTGGRGGTTHSNYHPNTFASVACCAPAMSYADPEKMPLDIMNPDALLFGDPEGGEQNALHLADEEITAAEAAKDRLVGLFLCLCSGLLYGVTFNPVFFVIDNHPGAPKNVLHYIFWHFTGIYVMSTTAMLCYCCVTKNRPSFVSPQTIFPGFLSGTVWGIGQICWFVANDSLGFCVAYPLVPSCAGLVACGWGALVFGEIEGAKNRNMKSRDQLLNYKFLAIGFVFVCLAGTCIGISS